MSILNKVFQQRFGFFSLLTVIPHFKHSQYIWNWNFEFPCGSRNSLCWVENYSSKLNLLENNPLQVNNFADSLSILLWYQNSLLSIINGFIFFFGIDTFLAFHGKGIAPLNKGISTCTLPCLIVGGEIFLEKFTPALLIITASLLTFTKYIRREDY